jgi:hypothetical protein
MNIWNAKQIKKKQEKFTVIGDGIILPELGDKVVQEDWSFQPGEVKSRT